jgi:hypothetical protein
LFSLSFNFEITGNKPELAEIKINAFPNPFLERINIIIQSLFTEKTKIRLKDHL